MERLRFEEKTRGLEEVITEQLSDGDGRAAQETLNVLKGEVQDATANSILTVYEMAKSNTSISRLQELIDAKGERGQGRKTFKFSASSKVRCATVADTSVGVAAAQGQEEVVGCSDSVFVDARKKVLFFSPSKALFLRNCRECGVFVLPVAGSVFISDCAQCAIYVAYQRLRLKNCTDINVYVSCSSRHIIECCTEMRFGSYSCWVGLLNSTLGDHHYDSHED
ncbi:putative Tubulin binding cofactor C [Trypanosoma vivax]|nr:putative Tubulin binding cofactor C [Trypanosoma vivax]